MASSILRAATRGSCVSLSCAGLLLACACGSAEGGKGSGEPAGSATGEGGEPSAQLAPTQFVSGPAAGNEGGCLIPEEALPESIESPDQVVGTGTPASCSADAFIEAVARGGTIVFDCGPPLCQ